MLPELERALDALTVRQQALSNNIANINTPNYTRRDVDFFSHMDEVFNGGTPAAAAEEDADAPVRLDGNNVTIERELFELVQTELLYNMVSRFSTGNLEQLKYAISEAGR